MLQQQRASTNGTTCQLDSETEVQVTEQSELQLVKKPRPGGCQSAGVATDYLRADPRAEGVLKDCVKVENFAKIDRQSKTAL
jgi:hypothetical protein